PARIRLALGVHRFRTELFEQALAEVLQDRRGLALAAGRGNDEVVGDQRYAANIEQHDIAGLFVRSEVDDSPCEVECRGAVRGRWRSLGRRVRRLGRKLESLVSL